MRKIFTFFFLLCLAHTSFSQDCNIGNWDTGNPDYTAGNFVPYYLVGVNFTLSEVGVVHALNMIGNGTGTDFQMAMYDDIGGAPNNLVVSTAISKVGTGVMTLPVTPVQLAAGDYWIMAVYNTNGSSTDHSNVNHVDTTSKVYYTELPFGNPIPSNGSGFEFYTGQDFLYFATISCGPLSVQDFQENSFSVSPNPASEFIQIGNLKENKTFEIYDITGKKLLEKKLNITNNQIDISHFATGTYFLKYGNSQGVRFLKY